MDELALERAALRMENAVLRERISYLESELSRIKPVFEAALAYVYVPDSRADDLVAAVDAAQGAAGSVAASWRR